MIRAIKRGFTKLADYIYTKTGPAVLGDYNELKFGELRIHSTFLAPLSGWLCVKVPTADRLDGGISDAGPIFAKPARINAYCIEHPCLTYFEEDAVIQVVTLQGALIVPCCTKQDHGMRRISIIG
jgi:hypothetical protein